jgi:hypothetical protein
VTKPPRLDLWADFNNEDDDGFGWSALHHASDPALVTPGARVIAGTERAWAVAEILAVDDDGMVHFRVLPRNDPDSRQVLADAANG